MSYHGFRTVLVGFEDDALCVDALVLVERETPILMSPCRSRMQLLRMSQVATKLSCCLRVGPGLRGLSDSISP